MILCANFAPSSQVGVLLTCFCTTKVSEIPDMLKVQAACRRLVAYK